MTREEAARLLEYHLKNEPTYIGLDDALRMAIAALNEPVSPTTQTDAQHAKKLTSNALAGTDYADRLRWILSQAERVARVDIEDRAAVDRACKLLKDIDNGFDAVRALDGKRKAGGRPAVSVSEVEAV